MVVLQGVSQLQFTPYDEGISMKKLRVIALLHEELVPPDDVSGLTEKQILPFQTEYDVCNALQGLGHELLKVGLHDELRPLRLALEQFKPHIVFNLLEEFRGEAVFDHAVVSYLDLMKVPYTGCTARAMVLARDKALTKKILHYHRILTPKFHVFPRNRKIRRPAGLEFPVIVKSQVEEASMGISQASVVHSAEKLLQRVKFIHESIHTAAIAEEYIEGRELYAGMLGNQRPQVLPIWELRMHKMPDHSYRIATSRVKWDEDYQKQHDIHIGRAKGLDPATEKHIVHTSKRIFRLLDLCGYARLDYRLHENGKLYLLEANPNPDISYDQELSYCAEAAGISYEQLIQKVLDLGLRRHKDAN